MEYYHNENNDQIITAVNNNADVLGTIQLDVQGIFDLKDGGKIAKMIFKFVKSRHTVPEIDLVINTGPSNCKFHKIPYNAMSIFKITSKF